MKLLVIYRPDSEHATQVESFLRDLKRYHDLGNKLETLSADSREGSSKASLYDMWDFPAILALSDDGSVRCSWRGMPLPLMDEVAGYCHDR